LHAEINPSGDLIDPGELEVDASSAHAEELAEPLDYDSFGRPNLEEATKKRAQEEYAYDSVKDESNGLRRVHRFLLIYT